MYCVCSCSFIDLLNMWLSLHNPEQLHVVLFWQSAYQQQCELVRSKCATAVGLSLLESADAGSFEASNTCF